MNNTSWRSHDRISNIVPKPPFYTREYFGPSYNTTAQHNNRIGDPDQSPVQKEVIPWLEDDKVSEPLCLSTLRLPEELELQRKALLGRQNLNKGTEKRAGSSDIRDTSPTSFSEDEVQKSQVWDEVVYKGDEATIFSDDHTQGPPDGKDFDVYRTTQYPDQLFARGGSSHTHIQDPSIGAEGIENDLPSKDGDPVLFEDDRFHKPPAKSFENYNDEEFKFSSSDDSLELHAEGDLKGPELVSFLRQQPSQEGAYKHQQPIPEFGVSVPISSIFGRSLMSDVDNDQISRGHHPQPSADPVIIPEAELIAHIKKSYTSTPPQNGEPPTFFPSTQMQHYPYNHPIEQLQNVSPPIFPIHPGGYFHYSDPGVSLSQRPIRIQNIFQRGPLAQQDYATLNTHRPPFHMESFHPLMEPFNLNSSQAIPGPFFPSPSTHGPKYASGDTIDRSDTIQRREDLRYTPSDLRRALTDKSHIPSSHQKSPST